MGALHFHFIENLPCSFPGIVKGKRPKLADGQSLHFSVYALVKAEGLGAGLIHTKDQAGNHCVTEGFPLGWVRLSGLDEFSGEFLYHRSMIRDWELPRQGQSSSQPILHEFPSGYDVSIDG